MPRSRHLAYFRNATMNNSNLDPLCYTCIIRVNFEQDAGKVNDQDGGKEKLILYWNSFNPAMGEKPLVDGNCPEKRCIFTDDLTLFDQSDVVLLYINTLSVKDLPTHRFPHQRFVYYAMESQVANFFVWILLSRLFLNL